jgi:hypothetical protein
LAHRLLRGADGDRHSVADQCTFNCILAIACLKFGPDISLLATFASVYLRHYGSERGFFSSKKNIKLKEKNEFENLIEQMWTSYIRANNWTDRRAFKLTKWNRFQG